MKNQRFEKYIYMGVTAVAACVAVTFVIFAFLERKAIGGMLSTVRSILAPVIYGAVLAFLLTPVYNFSRRFVGAAVCKKLKSEKLRSNFARFGGTVFSLIVLIAVVTSLMRIIIPQLYSSVMGIVNAMPTYIDNIYNWLTNLLADNPELEQSVLSVYRQVVDNVQIWASDNLLPNLQNLSNLQNMEKIVGGISSGVLNVVNLLKNLLIGIIVMVYLLNIKETLAAQGKKIIYAALPLKIANETVDEFRFINRVFGGFIIGKLIDSLIIGIICFFFLNLMRMPFTLLISVIVGVTNIIPFFGPFIGAVPSAVLVFLISPKQCLYFILFILLLQQFDGNILGPKILGNSTGLSSFWVLFSILFFGGLYGFVGMIIGVPVCAVLFDLMAKLMNYYLRKKSLSPVTEDYRNLRRIDEESGAYIENQGGYGRD